MSTPRKRKMKLAHNDNEPFKKKAYSCYKWGKSNKQKRDSGVVESRTPEAAKTTTRVHSPSITNRIIMLQDASSTHTTSTQDQKPDDTNTRTKK
jgi:hypothetical protein